MKRRLIFVSLCVAIAGGLVWLLLASLRREPSYQGKTLSEWLSVYDVVGIKYTHGEYKDCETAVRAIGPNAVPFLLKMLATPDSPWKQRLINFASGYNILRGKHVRPFELRMRGQMGIYYLGPEAKSAVPELIRMYDSGPMGQANYAILLGQIGPPAKAAIPKMLASILSFTNEMDQACIIQALGNIHSDASNVVPVLVTSLTNNSTLIRAGSAAALGKYESNAKAAVPALVKLAEQEPPNSRGLPEGISLGFNAQPRLAALDALSRIDKEAYENFTRSK